MTGTRVFGKMIKPKISDKVKISSKITFTENDITLFQHVEIPKTFKEHFITIPILNTPNKQSFST